ncbi:hypothetical protein ACFL2V_14775 [Pseudomonadota bacterium]
MEKMKGRLDRIEIGDLVQVFAFEGISKECFGSIDPEVDYECRFKKNEWPEGHDLHEELNPEKDGPRFLGHFIKYDSDKEAIVLRLGKNIAHIPLWTIRRYKILEPVYTSPTYDLKEPV